MKTGSFVYDVNVGLDNWQPSQVRISVYLELQLELIYDHLLPESLLVIVKSFIYTCFVVVIYILFVCLLI